MVPTAVSVPSRRGENGVLHPQYREAYAAHLLASAVSETHRQWGQALIAEADLALPLLFISKAVSHLVCV